MHSLTTGREQLAEKRRLFWIFPVQSLIHPCCFFAPIVILKDRVKLKLHPRNETLKVGHKKSSFIFSTAIHKFVRVHEKISKSIALTKGEENFLFLRDRSIKRNRDRSDAKNLSFLSPRFSPFIVHLSGEFYKCPLDGALGWSEKFFCEERDAIWKPRPKLGIGMGA